MKKCINCKLFLSDLIQETRIQRRTWVLTFEERKLSQILISTQPLNPIFRLLYAFYGLYFCKHFTNIVSEYKPLTYLMVACSTNDDKICRRLVFGYKGRKVLTKVTFVRQINCNTPKNSMTSCYCWSPSTNLKILHEKEIIPIYGTFFLLMNL